MDQRRRVRFATAATVMINELVEAAAADQLGRVLGRLERLDLVCPPLTCARGLGVDVAFEPETWNPMLLEALADESADYLQLLFDLERGSFDARATVAGRRRTSHAAAAAPSSLRRRCLGHNTRRRVGHGGRTRGSLLASLVVSGIAVKVTHGFKRRLFGPAPLRE